MVATPGSSIARILTVRNGRQEPLIPRPPLKSSAFRSDWSGMILEEHCAPAEYVRPDVKNCSTLVHVFTGVPVRHEWRVDGHTYRVHSPAGSILIVPNGFEGSVRCWRPRPETQWILEFEPRAMEQKIAECFGGAHLELTPHFDLTDVQALRLIQTLHADVMGGSPAGSLFGETVGAALALHLAQHYSTRSGGTTQPGGGLAEQSLKRVLEYIHSNLERDLHLQQLAEVANLSTFHFAKLFKRSTRCSPHQYVLQRRLERAQQLLGNPHISLSEVSLRAGFADQSHLSNVFRRFVGLTPSRFRALR
jgi:AraC family transcriptional regulator